MKYRRYPGITAIQDIDKGSSFSFSTVEKVDVIRKKKISTKRKQFMMIIFPLKHWKKMLTSSPNIFAFFTILQ